MPGQPADHFRKVSVQIPKIVEVFRPGTLWFNHPRMNKNLFFYAYLIMNLVALFFKESFCGYDDVINDDNIDLSIPNK